MHREVDDGVVKQTHPAGQAGLFNVSVRPARAVYLIVEGSHSGFRRAVQEASTRWGGACEPIVQVRADGSVTDDDLTIVKKANVDGVANVDVPNEHAQAIAESLGLELVQVEGIDRWGTTMFTSHPMILGLLPNTVDGSNSYVMPAVDAPSWHVAACGDLTVEHEAKLDPEFLATRRAQFGYEIGKVQLWGHTLIGCTTVSLGEIWASPAPLDSPTVVWLTQEDSLADCVGFWNLRALRPLRHGSLPMYLLPADISSWMNWPEVLHSVLRRPGRFAPDVMITSASVDADSLDAFARNMGLERAAEDEVRRYSRPDNLSLRSAPYTYLIGRPIGCFLFDRIYGELEVVDVPVVREITTLRFRSPVPLKPTAAGHALVRIDGDPFDGLPKRQCVATLVSRDATWRDEAIQVPAFLVPDYRIELHVPTLAAACEAVLAERTRSHAISQKGAVGMSLLDENAVEALVESDVYEAIRQLTTMRGEQIARELQKLFGKDQALTDDQREFAAQFAGRSEQEFRSADRLGYGTAQAAATALERLVGIGWAERGLGTVCATCGLTRFTPFSPQIARGPGRCPVCGTKADFTGNERGLTVHYRLDGRVDHANDQGVVAHLMAIGTMTRRYQDVWLVPGMDLIFSDNTEREADLFGICDGMVVSGEVKMSGSRFDDSQVKRDIDTATRLGADWHVMAATTPIPDHAKDLAASLCEEAGIKLHILERDDLRR